MVGPDKLITNNHCVSTQEQCDTTFIAVYDGTSYHSTRCRTIIKTETDGPDANDPERRTDYTLISVSEVYNGKFFPITAKGARPGEILDAWVVDHTGLDIFPPNLTDSRITQLECKVANQNSRASLMMYECPIIAGNSGSPVINRHGEVSGVLWGGTASTFDSTLDLDIRRQLDEIGLATPAEDFRNTDQPLP
jgi:V8-like Glu-specific endopeptidase